MKSPKLKALLGLYVFIMALGFVQSCCTQHYKIDGEGKMIANHMLASEPLPSDTLKGVFFIRGEFHTSFVTASNISGFTSAAYATSCESIYLNTLDKGSFILSVDKSFIHGVDTIIPGNNLLNLLDLKKVVNESSGWYRAEFDDDFLKNSKFQTGYHTFKMTGQTTDSIALEAELRVYLKL